MEKYDVIIVGAGPAGGQCARELSQSGAKVLLIEKAKDFSMNNYSSAGAPNEILSTYQLPDTVIASRWNTLHMYSSLSNHAWRSNEPLGVVMDFQKLRAFLADETIASGSDVKLGALYSKHEQNQSGVDVTITNRQTRQEEIFHSRILVDATGCERDVLGKDYNKQNAVIATGIEHLIDVPENLYDRYHNELSFYFGLNWMPQGYGWIFAMEPNRLKVGVGRYFQNESIVPHEKSYTFYLKRLMEKTLGDSDFPILDKHGKTLTYTYGQKDRHFDRNVIAIGDSISSLNPLAFEGIRHAMASGRISAKHILRFLNGSEPDFESYSKETRRYFGWKWKISETIMNLFYRQPDDRKIDLMLQSFQKFNCSDLMELAFHYKPSLALNFYFNYKKQSIINLFK